MTDTITLTGLVATVPHVVSSADRVPFISFRLASNQRYFDRRTSQWVAADTNWYTVTAFRSLATHAAASVHKGDRVLVTGRLKIRRWESGDKNGTSVDVEADSIGHDLVWGTALYTKTLQAEPRAAAEAPAPSAATDATEEATGTEDAAAHGGESGSWPVTTPGAAGGSMGVAAGDVSDTPF